MLETTNLDNGLTTAGLSLAPFGSLFTQSGVLRPTAFSVTALTSPGMFVEVSGSDDGDIAIIKTEDGSTYFIRNTLPLQVPILANISGVTKTDAIVLFVDPTAGDDDNAGSPGAAQVIAVRRGGISTGLPTDGEIDAQTGNNPWLFLKGVEVEHGTGEIEGEKLSGAPDRAYVVTDLIEPGSIVEALLGPGAVTTAKLRPTMLTSLGNGAGNIATTSGAYTNLVTLFSYTAGSTNERLHVTASGIFKVTSNAGVLRINATGTGVAVEDYSTDQIETTTYRGFSLDSVITVPAGETATITIQGFTFSAATMTILNANTTTQTWHGRLRAYNNS